MKNQFAKNQKAIRKLSQYLNKNYTEEEQEVMAWYPDEVTETHYIWILDLDCKKIKLLASFETGEVTREIVTPVESY